MSKKRFFPVIHCESEEQAWVNSLIATEYGADGVFLIGHGMPSDKLSRIYRYIRSEFPDTWIGINFLDLAHSQDWALLNKMVMNLDSVNGLWIDNLPPVRLNIPTHVEVFGGVAFKYIDPHIRGRRLKESCEKALEVVDTITTSGVGTGSAPDIEKLEEIRRNIGDTPRLALASGVTEENVSLFLPIVDTFLVASSVTKKRHDLGGGEYLISEKVKSLTEIIHSF